VSGRVIDIAGKQYLIISARVKNTGSSQLAFEERASGGRQVYDWKASGIRVLTTNLVRDAAMVGGVQWDHYVTLDFAPQAQWFDPGEQVTDEQMIELPAGKRAVKLELAIRFSSTEAGCTAIVGVPTKSLNLYVETDKVSVSDWLYKEANHESE
jgi:hypothetical protein